MRIRTVKPEFFLHEGLFELETETSLPIRISFAGLWCVADREGRFKWEPRKIGVQILPYDNIEFSRVLDALWTRGFIVKYRVDSVDYGWIPSFTRHQVINNRERDSEIPEPNDTNAFDACPTRAPRDEHAGKAEGKGKEGNMEGNGTYTPLPPKGGIKRGRKASGQSKVQENTPRMIRIGSWFGRQPETLWTVDEAKALEAINPSDKEIGGMEIFYTGPILSNEKLYPRKTLSTLLNNWTNELDKARSYYKITNP
jgi:hypothetical protein